MVGACGGQRCLAGDGVLNSSEMPAAKVMLFFFFRCFSFECGSCSCQSCPPATARACHCKQRGHPISPSLAAAQAWAQGAATSRAAGSDRGGLGEAGRGWGHHRGSLPMERYGLGTTCADHCPSAQLWCLASKSWSLPARFGGATGPHHRHQA